ncbi:MAG: segregation/condensation protein A [Christensenellaceae bacterium]|jgi:segregation and condensation protein A|nr:segregation/condensation protein A [Christensenellaceae bacterium]
MAYEVHLRQFDGPLDLLLHLIEQAEVDIQDIFISEITTQYLAFMREVDAMDMDTASEFLTMAATLVYIKSRALLPRPPKEEDFEEDPAEALIRQLREYKAIKEAGRHLYALKEGTQGAFARLPEEFALPPQEIIWEESSPQGLFEAFFELLNKRQEERSHAVNLQEVSADRYTVRSQLGKIRDLLRQRENMLFTELFEADASKMEMIVTFMALLDMLMRGEVHLRQSNPYDPIEVRAGELNEDDADAEYMDEL